ncbi:hypothetical protein ACFE04_031009 [Oxalis oulophora]
MSDRIATFGHNKRNWLDLPDEVTSKILSKLNVVDTIDSAKVCPSWRRICKQDSSKWRRIHMKNAGAQYHNMKSSGVKILRLVSCFDLTDKGLISAAAKLPLLEELELTYCRISSAPLKAFGKSCPLLKSFKFNKRRPRYRDVCNEEAIAIAENMPGLLHLQLFRSEMTDNGLQAIIAGCPHLESLDLRKCKNLSFKGALKKTCVERVKSLKLPDASLKRLRLKSRDSTSGKEMLEVAKENPSLEEIKITNLSFSKETLKAVGKYCPLLSTFKLNMVGTLYRFYHCDKIALVIAETMPGLRHLELVGNNLTDNGLRAILSGCPHLESLDLRRCYHLSIRRSNLEYFHADHIKALKVPFPDW